MADSDDGVVLLVGGTYDGVRYRFNKNSSEQTYTVVAESTPAHSRGYIVAEEVGKSIVINDLVIVTATMLSSVLDPEGATMEAIAEAVGGAWGMVGLMTGVPIGLGLVGAGVRSAYRWYQGTDTRDEWRLGTDPVQAELDRQAAWSWVTTGATVLLGTSGAAAGSAIAGGTKAARAVATMAAAPPVTAAKYWLGSKIGNWLGGADKAATEVASDVTVEVDNGDVRLGHEASA